MQINIPIIIDKIKLLVTATIIVLILGNIFFGIGYFVKAQQSQKLQYEAAQQKTNQKIIDFLILFTDKVLKSSQEVSFEDRLKLESTVRDLNDSEVLIKWQKFTDSSNTEQVQKSVVDLLEILIKKISY